MKKLTRNGFSAAGIVSRIAEFFSPSADDAQDEPSSPTPEYDPDVNELEDVYGPPPLEDDFDADDNLPVLLYGPPPADDGFDTGDNIPVTVYGPPSFFK